MLNQSDEYLETEIESSIPIIQDKLQLKTNCLVEEGAVGTIHPSIIKLQVRSSQYKMHIQTQQTIDSGTNRTIHADHPYTSSPIKNKENIPTEQLPSFPNSIYNTNNIKFINNRNIRKHNIYRDPLARLIRAYESVIFVNVNGLLFHTSEKRAVIKSFVFKVYPTHSLNCPELVLNFNTMSADIRMQEKNIEYEELLEF